MASTELIHHALQRAESMANQGNYAGAYAELEAADAAIGSAYGAARGALELGKSDLRTSSGPAKRTLRKELKRQADGINKGLIPLSTQVRMEKEKVRRLAGPVPTPHSLGRPDFAPRPQLPGPVGLPGLVQPSQPWAPVRPGSAEAQVVQMVSGPAAPGLYVRIPFLSTGANVGAGGPAANAPCETLAENIAAVTALMRTPDTMTFAHFYPVGIVTRDRGTNGNLTLTLEDVKAPGYPNLVQSEVAVPFRMTDMRNTRLMGLRDRPVIKAPARLEAIVGRSAVIGVAGTTAARTIFVSAVVHITWDAVFAPGGNPVAQALWRA